MRFGLFTVPLQSMAKYQAELRQMFISVFKDDHFLHDVDQDDAISMTLLEMGMSYESMSADIDSGLANGIPVSRQLDALAVAIGVFIVV